MKRHDTPQDVAFALSRHAPRSIRALLDPSVGNGNLIAPLVKQIRRDGTKVYCIDSDEKAINGLVINMRASLSPGAKFIHSDFLDWSSKHRRTKFDCIVMNPPFAASKEDLYRFRAPCTDEDAGPEIRHVPLEAAFLCRAVDLLDHDGRLLAIVPCSIVMSESLQWLRDWLQKQGAIKFVHELPPRSFPGVESRMYLIVFDKGNRQNQIELLNHDLHKPERLSYRLAGNPLIRLDFGYNKACSFIEQLHQFQWLQWKSLSDVASVIRGDINSPEGPKCAVHSTDFQNGFWHSSPRHKISAVKDNYRKVRRGDILMSRVGRNAFRTCGRGIGVIGKPCSDCVILIRPINAKIATKLLFALRAITSQDWAKPLIERGTGASYISHQSLLALPIPIGICGRFHRQYESFKQGQRTNSIVRSEAAVSKVAERLANLCR